MLYVIVGMAFTFLLIGMMLTDQNARYLLSGYNTLNAEEQKKVDIKSYVASFRKFHIGLAASFLIIELVLITSSVKLRQVYFSAHIPLLLTSTLLLPPVNTSAVSAENGTSPAS
jgi:hypothetical protein